MPSILATSSSVGDTEVTPLLGLNARGAASRCWRFFFMRAPSGEATRRLGQSEP
jgi:hypothetical protein